MLLTLLLWLSLSGVQVIDVNGNCMGDRYDWLVTFTYFLGDILWLPAVVCLTLDSMNHEYPERRVFVGVSSSPPAVASADLWHRVQAGAVGGRPAPRAQAQVRLLIVHVQASQVVLEAGGQREREREREQDTAACKLRLCIWRPSVSKHGCIVLHRYCWVDLWWWSLEWWGALCYAGGVFGYITSSVTEIIYDCTYVNPTLHVRS